MLGVRTLGPLTLGESFNIPTLHTCHPVGAESDTRLPAELVWVSDERTNRYWKNAPSKDFKIEFNSSVIAKRI